MADFVFNVALGVEGSGYAASDQRALLLQTKEADDDLRDRATIDAILAASNVEATATGYARVALTGEAATIDNTNNRTDFDADDADFSNLGNGTNNTIVSVITYRHVGADTANIPVSHHDVSFTTDGTQVIIQWAAAGIWRAAG